MSDTQPQPQTTAPTNNPAAAFNATTVHSFKNATRSDTPFTHWALTNLLPEDIRQELINLPVEPATNYGEIDKRNMLMGGQQYLSADWREKYPVCQKVSELFADPAVV